VLSLTGSVPQGARTAVVVLRVNSEEAGPGQADFNLYEVGYSETGGANRVANPRFAAGLKGWSPYGAGKANVIPSDRGAGYMLHVRASPVQPLHVDSDAFDVVPGSQFELRLAVSVPLASAQSAYAAVVFLDGTEVQRQMLAVAPLVIDLGMQTTGSDGRVSIYNGGLDPGRYRLHVRYAGDLDYWPSWIDVETQI
jgi:hypothetical protein